MKFYLVYILALFISVGAYAQVSTDSVSVYFRVGHSQFEPAYDNNSSTIASFIDRLNQAGESIDYVVVRGYASPEGLAKVNNRLAKKRCESVAHYIISNSNLDASLVRTEPEGIGWGVLRKEVETAPDVPSREKILDVLDNVPEWVFNSKGRVVDGRKKRLMEIDGGRPYKWMLAHLFPRLRKAVAVAVYLKNEVTPVEVVVPAEEPEIEIVETEIVSSDTIVAPVDSIEDTLTEAPVEDAIKEKYLKRFALKTNLLYYGVVLPNLELEWHINKDWSVSIEGDVAWWSNRERNKFYQLAVITPEVRRWIKNRDYWHGMYVGIFGGGGLYDLENGGTGRQGSGGMAGLSFGYMWPVWKNLSFEAGIGAGYMYTRYKEYQPLDGHKLYLRTKNMNYFGPLKLKFSIVWLFDFIKTTRRTNL